MKRLLSVCLVLLGLIAMLAPMGPAFAEEKKGISKAGFKHKNLPRDGYFDTPNNWHVQEFIPKEGLFRVNGPHTSWKFEREFGRVRKMGYKLYYSEAEKLHYHIGSGQYRGGNGRAGILSIKKETAPGSKLYRTVQEFDFDSVGSTMAIDGRGGEITMVRGGGSTPTIAKTDPPAPEKPTETAKADKCDGLPAAAKAICKNPEAAAAFGGLLKGLGR